MPTAKATVPLWRYTVELDPNLIEAEAPRTTTVDAVAYHQDGPWTTFDDTRGTVLIRRTNTILEIRRSDAPVGEQETDE